MSTFQIPESGSNRQSDSGLQACEGFSGDTEESKSGIALALGGGFSRGFAHLGVLEVLAQERIPISTIVGTSVGALLGAAYAHGISVTDLCDLGRRVHIRDFLRFQSSGRKAEGQRNDCIGQFVQEWFRVKLIEELAVPVSIVATDLDTAAPYVFSRGPLEVAIRASCAFPGLVKPVEHEGHLLADGCIVAPVPTEIAARYNDRHGNGCVLGVNVSSKDTAFASSDNVVRVFDSRYRASNRIAAEPSWRRYVDVLLEPQVHHIEWGDFSRVDEAVAAGAVAMRRALPHIREFLLRHAELPTAPGVPFGGGQGLTL